MTKSFTLALATILLCALFGTAHAQTPTIEITTDNERAQFSIQGDAQAVQLEVFAPSGELLFEAEVSNALAVEWPLTNNTGERVADGVYLATITITDTSGRRRKRIEQITVSSATEEKQAPADVPTINAAGAITGAGSTGKIPKFTAANAIGNSIMTEYANRLGINIAAPTATLLVNAVQPAPLASNGTSAIPIFQITGGKGGNTTGTTNQLAGAGASISLMAGSGGDAPAGGRRGNGGNITIQPGSTGGGAGKAGLNGNVLIAPTGVGNVGIGTGAPTSRLTVNGMIETVGAGGIKFPDGSIQTKANSLTVVGTANQLVKFTGASSFGNSTVTESAGRIGIGTTSPASKLTVNGGIQILGTGNGIKFPDGSIQTKAIAGTINGTGTTGQIVKFTGPNSFGNSVMRENAGNIGIGVSSPAAKLDVAGGINVSGSASIALYAKTSSGGEAVYGQCLTADNNCYAVLGVSPSGDYAGYFIGGRGVYASSSDDSRPALKANASGSNAYSVDAQSTNYRAGYFKSANSGLYSLYVDAAGGPTQGTSALEVNGSIRAEGNLYIAGSKSGYVVDIMQNVGSAPLEPGDLVVIVGNGPPVIGQIPVVTVRKATSAYDTAVAGIVDQVMYAPDAATKAAYESQEQAIRTAMSERASAEKTAGVNESKSVKIAMPAATINDEQGTLHALQGATTVAQGGYATVVTLGSFKMVKVDASFGAIRAGDLLTSSPNPGYAMKATDKVAAIGAIIGKALGNLASGTGTIPVMVMPQ